MKVFQSKDSVLPGSSRDELYAAAKKEYKKIEKLTKRQPYVRSTYFTKDKIFMAIFWQHLAKLSRTKQTKRLKLYKAAIDLLRKSHCELETIFSKDELSVLLHRFYGVTKDGVHFCVQVKHNKRTGRKDFMSVFERKAP